MDGTELQGGIWKNPNARALSLYENK